ncbi:sodium:proton antiporter NhaD [Motiliproteus sp. MSK22-1]|uniref:sodium:proton antiporter NhaD n=1 Tax=Motiliproteus sp. MSK22-1 TaxID=1897630 RepID=UPI000977E5DF|nr:sodium:proton antiporter NhaD [Motiliproteus sp. MSK22-1]OMH39451.1 sodium:proton antiporter [Motiliproteus sp. MSK22-1]
MSIALVAISSVFVLGYLAIVTEHNIHVDKTASAIMTGVLCWTIYILASGSLVDVANLPAWFAESQPGKTAAELATAWVGHHQLLEFLSEISSILFFLLGAMTIVELVDAYGGFAIITDRIKATNTVKLLWTIGLIAFFMSAALDNLTTTIVMISLIRKLIAEQKDRLFFAGIIVIAANAGGAWSPIGDVTTTMLWIGGQITTLNIIHSLLLPSLFCLLVPLLFLSFTLRGKHVTTPEHVECDHSFKISRSQRNLIFAVGMGGLLFVPVFKTLTHLPPFMGMMLSLSVLWIISELMHRHRRDEVVDAGLHIVSILKKIDSASVLFFLGILLAVAALQATGLLASLAAGLDSTIGNIDLIIFLIGLLSAVVDNVPLVAAAMGMYDMSIYPTDSRMWEFLAYSAGTGGSCLIIGSAAGVAAMGMERINFFWYMKVMTPLALMGYLAGALFYQFV